MPLNLPVSLFADFSVNVSTKNLIKKQSLISLLLLGFFLNLALSFPASAADKAIIVFDASGSMWGQLEGKTKIAIAKKTLANVVTNWDEEKQLGLLAYGHRKKGDCSDIETLVPVGKINKAAMISKVNKINPKGKTPISASIKMAAEELKFTEDNATVILISDGKETCNADPCETAAELEKLGVNFTAHVIGFGVDKKTSEQLQCIAANTGGLYFPANNAEQLNDALKKVVETAKLITIRAMDEKNGGIFHKMIDWKLINQETEEVISLKGSGAGVEISLASGVDGSNDGSNDDENKADTKTDQTITSGKWLVSGTSGNYAGEATVDITNEDQLIKVDFNKQLPKVTLIAADEAITGTELEVSWEAPKDLNGLVNLQIGDEKPKYHASPLTHTQDKTEAILRLPSVSGDYVLRFYDNEDRVILAEHPIKLKEAEIVINAPEEAGTGTELDLSWLAPKESKAKINLEAVGDKPKFHSNPTLYVDSQKKEGIMRMPATAGDYVLRWYNQSDQKIVTEKPIKLVESSISLDAPEESGTASEIELTWEAPKTTKAKINLEQVDEKPKFHSNPTLYIDGKKKEGVMRMPATAGEYVLRWYNQSDQKLVTEKPIKLTETIITITAPDEAETGTEIELSWDAPKTIKARINLEPVDEKPKFHSNPNLHINGKKNQGVMRLPSTSGDYVLRWYNQSDQKLVTEKPIKLTETIITLTAPNEAETGTEIELSWDAPETTKARINLEQVGEKPKFHSNPNLHINDKKKQGVMRSPSTSGDYVLRWYNQSDQKVVTEKPIKLIESIITLNAPDEAGAGAEIDVSWEAPASTKARINLEPVGDKPKYHSNPNLHINGKKKQAVMRMPATAGEYVLRWYNHSDQKVITERPIKITEQTITINAPESAIAGSEIEISWDAPKGLKSFINMSPSDEKPNYNAKPYLYTKKNSSAYMRMPSEPGDYTFRWYVQNDRTPLAEKNITLTPLEITLTAADEVIAGTETEVSWEAPKGLDSFINIQLADEKPNYNAKKYVYTKKKTSDYLRLPADAGDYVLRWYNRGHKKPIAERPIKLIEPEITINVPDEIKAGTEIEISWDAPKGLYNPFINIQKSDEKPNYNAKKYIYTKKKQSDYMLMPEEPGEYILRWYNQSVRKAIAEKNIVIK